MIARLWAAIWPNVAAEPVCIVLAGLLAVVFRDWIGRHLAAWWHKHHGEHSRADLEAMESRLKAHMEETLTAHHARMVTIIGGSAAGERMTRRQR